MLRRRKKDENRQLRESVPEPLRKSLYDVLQTNLKIAKRVNFIHRVIYIGEHKTGDSGLIVDFFEYMYKASNSGYCTEPLSGILLYYNAFFCCIVEGAEDVLHRSLSLLLERAGDNLYNIRLLTAIHHIKARFLNDWMSYYGRPQERVEEIDPNSDLENSMRYVQECCERMYLFANAFIADQMQISALMNKEENQEEPSTRRQSRRRSKSIVERDVYCEHIPEVKLLKFLSQCKYLQTLKQFYHYYEYIGQSIDYSLKTWPAPKNFTPYDVFDEPYDPITDLPIKEQGPIGTKSDLSVEKESEIESVFTEKDPSLQEN